MRCSSVLLSLTVILLCSAGPVRAEDFDGLIARGDSLYRLKQYRESIQSYEKAFRLGKPNGSHYYNAACCWALTGNRDQAFRYLEKSRKMQGLDIAYANNDGDLESLRGDKRWKELLIKVCNEEFDLKNPGANDYFRAAECFALAGDKERSFKKLEQALAAGFVNDQLMLKYSDALQGLRTDSRWKELTSRLEENVKKTSESFPSSHRAIDTLVLSAPRFDGAVSVEKALRERRSIRRYSGDPVSLTELSQLLWAAYGITYTRENTPAFLRGGLKTAPSAGARYPLELYVVAYNVSGLPAGIYWYHPQGHKLSRLSAGDFRDELAAACWNQDWLKGAALSIVYSAVYARTTERYGERGRDRYVCMDLGHSAENVYLQCGSMELGTCAIGAFVDIELKKLINMTREEEPLYVMPVGKPAPEPE
ncbi:MAG: SagB family peptide dehydrogenase [Candidatus Krumholzibacteriota bacterium]|nr:SagB family peptide dehydrogenase [Candidatus Krumholzibacteriota bacterium]